MLIPIPVYISYLVIKYMFTGDCTMRTFIHPLTRSMKKNEMKLLLAAFSGISRGFSTSSPIVAQHIRKETPSKAMRLSDFILDLCTPPPKRKPDEMDPNKLMSAKQQNAVTYWASMDFPPNTQEQLPLELVQQFHDDVARMNTGQLVHLLNLMADKNIRHPVLLSALANSLVSKDSLNVHQIATTMDALSMLTFLHEPLISRLKRDFMALVTRDDTQVPAFLFTKMVTASGHLHLSDQRFWRQMIEWLEGQMESQEKFKAQGLTRCIGAFSLANIDVNLIARIVKKYVGNASRAGMTPRNWLTIVHTITVLQALNTSMAEKVLNAHFVSALEKQQKEGKLTPHTIYYDAIRLKNISSTAHLAIPDYKGINLATGDVEKEALEYVRQVKFGIFEQPALTNFELLLRLVAPRSHSTGPEWHQQTGAILEGRCFVDPARNQLVPLREVEGEQQSERKKECREVAILFFLENHLTRIFDAQHDVGTPRLLGIYQLSVRNLKAAGLHPVVFTEREFAALGDNEKAKSDLIRAKICTFSEHFHANEWPAIADEADEATNDVTDAVGDDEAAAVNVSQTTTSSTAVEEEVEEEETYNEERAKRMLLNSNVPNEEEEEKKEEENEEGKKKDEENEEGKKKEENEEGKKSD